MINNYKLRAGMAGLLLAGSLQPAFAQVQPVNVTTTAVPSLRIAPDARAGGMGDLGIATSPDANSHFYNAAKIPFAGKAVAAGVNYSPWLKDIAENASLTTATGYYQWDGTQSLSAGIRYFNMGDVDITDQNGVKWQTAQPREWAVDLAYARKLSGKLGLGVTLRYIHSKTGAGVLNGAAYKAGTAVAGDLSLYYSDLNEKGAGFTAGAVLSNLGSRINYTNDANNRQFLPARLGIGGTWTIKAEDDHAFMLGLDVQKLLVPAAPGDSVGLVDYYNKSVMESWFTSFDNGNLGLSVGGEYVYKDLLSLRLGYMTETQRAGDRKGFTAGVGLHWSDVGINFSYLVPSGAGVTRNPLGNSIRIGLVYRH